MISAMLIKRPILLLSFKNRIPTITVPTAPMPTQIPYAVPIGKVFIAIPSSQKLRPIVADLFADVSRMVYR